jgi:cytochrome P450
MLRAGRQFGADGGRGCPPRFAALSLVQTLRFFKDPFALMTEAFRLHGDIFSLKLYGFGEMVFLCSPELYRQMCRAPADVLAAGEANSSALGEMVGKEALFCLDGEAHGMRRRLIHPHLNGREVSQHIPMMRRIALRALSRWPEGRPFPVLDDAHRISLDVMMHAFFAAEAPERVDGLADRFDAFARRFRSSPFVVLPYFQVDLGPWSPWGKIVRARRAMAAELRPEIKKRIAARDETGEPGSGAGDILFQVARTAQGDGRYLTENELFDEVVNLLFAGLETTGNLICWTMETLHSHPEVLRQVYAELDRVLQGRPIEAEHLEELAYLDAVIKETLRFRPLGPFAGMRRTRKPIEIGGYLVPRGVLVLQGFSIMANRRDLFANPEQFDPRHFYGKRMKPFEWNPFGGGTRKCIGAGFAEVELKVVLATILQHAKLRLGQKRVRPVRAGPFFSPNKGLRMIVEERL